MKLPAEIIGEMVLFHYNWVPVPSMIKTIPPYIIEVAYIVYDLQPSPVEEQVLLYGAFLAGEYEFSTLMISSITDYRIITRKELPLLLGCKHTSVELTQLIKGEITV